MWVSGHGGDGLIVGPADLSGLIQPSGGNLCVFYHSSCLLGGEGMLGN